jgi:MFS family permease
VRNFFDENIHCRISGISILFQWDLVCDRTYAPKLTITVQFIGLVIGAATAGQLADSYGRKPCTLAFLVLLFISQTLVGIANTWEVFAILRGLVGVFAGKLVQGSDITASMPADSLSHPKVTHISL